MATKGKVDIEIKAKDEASAKMGKIGKSTANMSANFKKAGLAMTAMGAAMVFALVKVVNSYSKAGDEVAKMAKRTGFGTEALSELRHVANITGADLGTIEKATKKMSKSLVDASDGMTTYIRAFERINLNVEDLMRLAPEDQFWAISNAIGSLEDPTLRAATAQDIFGRAGTALLPMMAETGEAIAALRQEAHDLNLVFDEEAAAAAEAFEDAKTRLKGALMGIGAAIAQQVMPHLEKLIVGIKDTITKVIDWGKEHPKLTDAITKFGLALMALCITGGPMLLVAGYIPKMIAGFVMLRTVLLTTLIPALVKATLAFIAMLASMGPWGWAALAGGIIAAGAAIAGLAAMGLLGGAPKTRPATPEEEAAAGGPLPPVKMQYGGIVPGPIGRPVPVLAHGGEAFAGAGAKLGTTVNVYVAGSVIAETDLTEMIREELLRIKDRNVTTGL